MVTTPWGEAHIIGKTIDGGLLVSLSKKAMTVQHPNYYGGPCVNFLYYQKEG